MICQLTDTQRMIPVWAEIVRQGLPKIEPGGVLDDICEVGSALAKLRDSKFYKPDYGTFEKFCEAEFGLSRSRAYQLINASERMEILSTAVDIKPQSEWQIRPLSVLPLDEVADAWSEAVESAGDGKVTERHVAEAVKRRRDAKPPTPWDWLDALDKVQAAIERFRDSWPEDRLPALAGFLIAQGEALQKDIENASRRAGASSPTDASGDDGQRSNSPSDF